MSEILIPEKLSEIPLSDFQSYSAGLTDDMSEDNLNYHTVSTLCGGSVESIGLLSVRELKLIAQEIHKLINQHTEVIYEFKMQGVEYGLIPDMANITAREWTNIMQFLDNGRIENLHHVLAILYRPIVKRQFGRIEIKREVYSDKRAELFKRLGMDVVQGVMLFFSKIIDSYSRNSKDYLRMKEKTKTGRPKDLAGII